MRVACVSIPHFYVQTAQRDNPALEGKPLVVGGAPDEKGPVIDCSEELAERGIFPSMPLKDAYRLSRDAVFVPLQGKRYRSLWGEILSALAGITLRVESDGPSSAFLDITRLPGGVYGSEEQLSCAAVRLIRGLFNLPAKAGVGNSRFVASEAALRASSPVLVVRPGNEKEFLSPLAIDRLPVPPEVKERLGLLGLTTLGRIQALSLPAILSQFGAPGKVLWECASGVDDPGRIPGSLAISEIEEDMVLEAAAYSKGQIREALVRLLDGLCHGLGDAGMACRAMKLALHLENRACCEKHFVFHSPETCRETMLRRIMSGLEHVELASPVRTMSLCASALSPHAGRQEGLFRMRQDITARLHDMGSFLKTKYGCMPVVRVRENDMTTLLPDERFIFVEP
jgi:DNA polymerase IV